VSGVYIEQDSLFVDKPDSHLNLFSRMQYNLYKDIEYVLRFEFFSSFYYCIEQQDLAATNIKFPA
jgi:hypothetical protein